MLKPFCRFSSSRMGTSHNFTGRREGKTHDATALAGPALGLSGPASIPPPPPPRIHSTGASPLGLKVSRRIEHNRRFRPSIDGFVSTVSIRRRVYAL